MIALDTSTVSTDQTASPLIWNHTCTGGNLLLIVGVYLTGISAQPTASSVTYGGVSMVKAISTQFTASTLITEASIWILANPLGGSNQVSVTVGGGTTTPHYAGVSASYTGAQQSSAADATGSTTFTTTGDKTFTVTTVKDNCWIFLIGGNVAGTGPTLTADQTSRQTLTLSSAIAAVMRAADTNAAQTPAGAKTVGMTSGATLTEDGGMIVGASFAPTNAGTAMNDFQFIKIADNGNAVLSVSERIK